MQSFIHMNIKNKLKFIGVCFAAVVIAICFLLPNVVFYDPAIPKSADPINKEQIEHVYSPFKEKPTAKDRAALAFFEYRQANK